MKTTLYPGLWSIKAMLMLVVMIITGCSDDKISDDSGGVTPAKDFSALMTVLRDMEKKGEISTVKQGTNASTNRPYASFYVLQPVNHYDEKWQGEESNSLWQRVCIVDYQGENAPTLLNTNGYAMDKNLEECKYPDIAKLLQSNVVEVEHRYCGESLPTGTWDWQYNKAIHQSADIKRVVDLLKSKGLFKGKWVASGTSKSGMTTTFLAMHYPETCDMYVAFCAPFCTSLTDPRCGEYLINTCYKNHPQTVRDQWDRSWQFMVDLLQNKHLLKEVLEYNRAYLVGKGFTNYAQASESTLKCNLVNTYYHAQYGKAMYNHVSDWAKYIPDDIKEYTPDMTNKEHRDYVNFLRRYCYLDNDTLAAWGVVTKPDKIENTAAKTLASKGNDASSDDRNADPYTMQTAFELGNYILNFSRVKPYVTDAEYKELLHLADAASDEPYAKYRANFEPIAPQVKEFVKTTKAKVLFVYGENDPFTGAGITSEDIGGNPNVQLLMVPDGVHNENFLDANYSPSVEIGPQVSKAIKDGMK
jgi:pimeloyl-ACP methyl ester carboxylesterase